MTTWNDPCPECGAELECQHRPPLDRPPPLWPFSKWWKWLWLLPAAAVLAGCTSGPHSGSQNGNPVPVGTPATATVPSHSSPPTCGWYTATAKPGQVVTVTAVGSACTDRSLIGALMADTDRPWTTTAVIPGAEGSEVGMVVKGGTTATVWFTGPPTGQAGKLAVNVANALLASGWKAVPQ
jgi:hypothetical protein